MIAPHELATRRVDRRKVAGATLLTIEDRSLPVVRFIVALRGGSLGDPAGRAGLTRVMMDLMLRGTEQHDRTRFNYLLEEMGSALQSLTGPHLALLRGAALTRHLPATVELAGEALASPAFAAAELAPLLEEIIDSLRAERDEDEAVAEIFLRRALYGDHPLARLPQGEIAELSGLEAFELRQAHARRFCASRILVAVAGDIEPQQAATLFEPILRRVPGECAEPHSTPEPPDTAGPRILVVDKPERRQAQLRLARSTLSGAHPDAYAFWVGTTAFGGTFTSTFTHEVRDVRGWSYVAHADFDRRSLSRAPFVLRSAPASEDAVACLELELDLYRGLARGELEADDLTFARTYLLNRYPLETASASDVLFAALRNELLGLPPAELLQVPARLEALDLGAVGSVMRRHLDPAGVVVVMVASAGEVLPALRERFASAVIDVVDFREGLQLLRRTG